MPLSLIFRALGVPNIIGFVPLDATLQEMHERTSVITDHPIEGGSFIQDHIVRNPRRLIMEGFITDTPLRGFSLGVRGSFEVLDLLWQRGQPFTVVSGLRVYPRMAFESLNMPKTRESSMRFTAQMKEITITSGQTAAVAGDQPADPALAQGNVTNPAQNANGADLGRQTTQSAPVGGGSTGGTGATGGATGGGGSLLSRLF